MFGSEVLDAAAIGAAAALLGGIIAGVFSLLAIRMNHKADRAKIAFEKRIEAMREISEAISIHADNMLDYSYAAFHKNHDVSGIKIQETKSRYEKSEDILRSLFRKNRALFTKQIDKAIIVYLKNIHNFPDEVLLLQDMGDGFIPLEGESIPRIAPYASKVLDKIQQFIGSK